MQPCKQRLINLDICCDYCPVFSTVTNLIDLITKIMMQIFVPKIRSDKTFENSYFEHLQRKTLLRCVLLILIPGISNIYYYYQDWKAKKDLEEDPKLHLDSATGTNDELDQEDDVGDVGDVGDEIVHNDSLSNVNQATSIVKADICDSEKLNKKMLQLYKMDVSTIEKRARPVGTDGIRYNPVFFDQSSTGFLGVKESFQQVLLQDWETVERLKTTHIELARHLSNIIEQAGDKISQVGQETTIQYHLTSETIPPSTQTIRILNCSGRNYQADLFGRASPQGGSQYRIINVSTGVEVNLTDHTYTYIKELGFYQGGERGITPDSDWAYGYVEANFRNILKSLQTGPNTYRNPYRIPPVKLWAILTGDSEQAIIKKFKLVL